MDIIKNYLLWPILALVLTLSIYLVLVSILHKILIFSSNEQEELLWDFISDNLLYTHIETEKQNSIQILVDQLPNNALPQQYSKIKILISNNNHINAFAAPGGRIIITTGLLKENLSEQALLFVIGHEIAHLARKDHLYEFAKMIVSKAYGKITGSTLVTELLMLVDSYKVKETEFIADQYSSDILLNYYGNNAGGKEFFEYLIAKDKNSNISTSHPDTKTRLEKMDEYLF